MSERKLGNTNSLGNTGRLGIPHTAESIEANRINQPNRMSILFTITRLGN